MYKDYLDINKKFKASVNLEYDLLSDEKIDQYIPTTDLCDVIKKYIKNTLKNTNFKATTLSGPYGKGKSYLLLIILYLLSKKGNKTTFEKLCKKIKSVDEELYSMIIDYDKSESYLLPVIINNNAFDDLNKNFLSALGNSLEMFGFDDIVPNTSYAEALNIINTWSNSKSEGFDLMDYCLKMTNVTIDEIKKGLKKYDSFYFKKFTDLYNCISKGAKFYTLKSDDIVVVYDDIAHKLIKKDPKCKGIFVVFDEFGAFLSNQSSDFVNKLNKIQSFAEKCNDSDLKCQMHFCCITHKDLLLYKKEKSYSDAFDTISGRFEPIRFDRSLDENYQIICAAIEKKNGYNKLVSDFILKNNDFLNRIMETGLFKDNQLEHIINNAFPLNPISLYCLIQVSEKIAQNERSLFTFLSDSGTDGFRYFITNNNIGLLNVDTIYDYFEPLIKNSDEYKMIFYKIESLSNNFLKNNERSIFKSMAIIKIINDSIRFNCTIDNIALSLGMDYDYCKTIIDDLIINHALKRNVNDDSIDFALIADNQLLKAINDEIEFKFSDIELGKYLTEYDKNKYEFSNEYNFNYKMVRFYKKVYIEASKIIQMNDLSYLLEEECKKEFSDGLILNIINDCNVSEEKMRDIAKENPENLIIRFTSNMIKESVICKIKELAATRLLINNSKDFSDNAIKTLKMLADDIADEITVYLNETYDNATLINKCIENNDLKKVINKSFEAFYSKTIIMNNEQVNKNDVPIVSIKARNNVIDDILKQNKCDFGKTSQEATIYNSFINSKKEDVLIVITDYICESNGNKISLNNLISTLKSCPYGMRNGIIPIYVAKAIADLSIVTDGNIDTVILYNDKTEIDMDANNLSKACLSPDNYYICYANVSHEKIEYINNMMNTFNCNKTQLFSDDIRLLNKSIKDYVSALSPIIVKSCNKDNLLDLSKESIKFKDLYFKLNTNNYEMLFKELPEILKCDYCVINNNVQKIIKEYSKKIDSLYKNIIDKTKELFDCGSAELKTGVEEWMKKYDYIDNIVFENKSKSIYNSLKNLKFNDKNAINTISFACVNCSVEELNNKKYNDYFSSLSEFIEMVKKYDVNLSVSKDSFGELKEDNVKLSSLASTLYSNILESVEEYGDAVSNEEKALIYKKLLNELLK